ncbi:transcription factor bHLH140 isoform X2 [Magnolia sinica]|uniref:transcription factor bHLH140 isoform X2 n=1 Tax=Magnolia sinica TaxID=86752 RepID=UPI00265A2650|nr:transcription factor bHLH140 isoform X2 [Magnolia sinica]
MEGDCDLSKEDSRKVIVVILMGAPGSGKTTFCNDVMSTALRPWVRICQDSIANGKAGTKSQCLKSAAEALKHGKSVFIDRCNLDREQRVEFVKLGGPQVDVHAVVLDLPAKLCISRSVKRTGHEGNLQGGKAAAVVNRMLQKKELPKLSEGYSRITFCQNETDVLDAVNTYRLLGPSDNLSSGCFGQKSTDSKVQVGIMKFLKKVDVPNNVASNGNSLQDSVNRKQNTEKDSSSAESEKINTCIRNTVEKVTEGSNKMEGSFGGGDSWNDIPTLAFPSISTADFQFSHEKASDIIVEQVEEFLNKGENVRLVLVDLTHGSHMLSLVGAKAAKKNIDSRKFFTVVGDITKIYTERGLRCNVIANAANWRLRPGGGGVNAAIFSAAGEALEIATKEQGGTLAPGKSVAIPLPPSSPLYKREGVTHVIHVLGPNMNPQRPNCLRNDYIKGCNVLREAYSSLFKSFASIVREQNTLKESSKNFGPGSSDSHKNLIEQFPNTDQKIKREGCYESERNKKSKALPFEQIVMDDECGHSGDTSAMSQPNENMSMSSVGDVHDGKVQQKNEKIDRDVKKSWGSWAQALYHIAMHPEQHKDNLLEILDDVVVLYDLYPKAKRHLLVLARRNGLDRLADVQKEHLQLLRTMHSVGLKWAEKFLVDDASLIFRLGYHSAPSMRQLHLHVISQDFNSSHLKNKKHWNSFNTAFFRDSVDVIEEIENQGKAILNSDDKLLSMELRCHRCRSAHPNIPRLKAHISNCRVPFPAALLQNGCLVHAPSRPVCEA